jgi:glucosamine-6-phosphate deaminase
VHDNPLGQRLTALMISKGMADASVPMSLLADHPNVQSNDYRGGLGHSAAECTGHR